jgi:hypothetical protein
MTMSSGNTDRRSLADALRRRDESVSDARDKTTLSSSTDTTGTSRNRADGGDALSMFDSEGFGEPTPAAEPVVSQTHVQSRSDDVVHVVRERLLAHDSEANGRASIIRRATAKLTIDESVSNASARISSATRDYLVQHPKLLVRAASIACILIAALIVGVMVGGSEVVPPTTSSTDSAVSTHAGDSSTPTNASASPAPTAPEPAPVATTASAPSQPTAPPRATTASAPSQPVATPQRPTQVATLPQPVRRTAAPAAANGRTASAQPAGTRVSDAVQVPAPTPTVGTIAPVPSQTARPLSATSIPLSIQNEEDASVVYSEQDRDVRPPHMIEAELPRPTVPTWTTVRNAMEVVVADDGSVERVKWLGSPQRMSDVMLLSRAKLWKFAPATKDGHPVRYRLVLTWEVNP